MSGSGIEPAPCQTRISFDTPPATYPATLATLVVTDETPVRMKLPNGPLPVPKGIPSIRQMLRRSPGSSRSVVFDNCGNQPNLSRANPNARLPTCGWYHAKYNAAYRGGTAFNSLLMMRDGSDTGYPNPVPNPNMPLVGFKQDGLFHPDSALFLMQDRYEEWTLINRSFSDHTFHIHQNPSLVTHVNGKPLAVPEWHDTILMPAAEPQPVGGSVNINQATYGTITFRTYLDSVTRGNLVMHCHRLQHEDLEMMRKITIGGKGP